MAGVAKLTNVRTESFWGELAPREHSVQIYGSDEAFLDALEGYVSAGLRRQEGVILLASAAHLHALEKRLRANWLDIDRARWDDSYIALLAHESLARFMVDGTPDVIRFERFAASILERARGPGRRKVRAFGEMVAVLWAEGNHVGAIELEALWNRLQLREEFPLFCAYPRAGFDARDAGALRSVCAAHTRIVPGYA